MPIKIESHCLKAIRGATTCEGNNYEYIEASVKELISELIERNALSPQQIVSVTFSVTKDLDACFPASIARKCKGWEDVALLDCQQMHVKSDLSFCIRILAHVLLPFNQKPNHPYLQEAKKLRPDR